MILTNTRIEPIFLSSSPQFVEVRVFSTNSETNNETGVKSITIKDRGTRWINMALVSEIKPTTIKEFDTQLTPHPGLQWIQDANSKIVKVRKELNVYALTALHSSIKLNAHFVQFIAGKETK